MSEASTSQAPQPLDDDFRRIFEGITTMDDSSWLTTIRDKLYTMFRSPMTEEYTHEAFKWVAHLCLSINDFSWISPDDKWSKEEAQIFSCIVRLSLSEVHILLPPIQRHLTCGDDPEIEDGKVLARPATSEEYDRFGNHLVILESAIKSLVKGQGGCEEDQANLLINAMDKNDLKNLLDRLKDTISLVCEYLELVHRYWSKLPDDRKCDKYSAAQGALRLMLVWLSEEPEGFEPQCKRFLIDLILNNLVLPHKSIRHDLLILALHSVCTNDPELMKTLKQKPHYREALEGYLRHANEVKQKSKESDRRKEKILKLQCGLIKDLMS